MFAARLLARKFSNAATKAIAVRWGESFPFYHVCEFPKAGGTWLAKMLGDYLQLPFPQVSVFPIGFSSVLLSHWSYDPRLRRVLYVYRDGRDVVVSLFFHRVRLARSTRHPGSRILQRRLDRIFGAGFDPEDTSSLLPKFIEHEFRRPGAGTRLSWNQHIESWGAPGGHPHVGYLSYEELRRDTAGTLGRAVEAVTGEEPDPQRVAATVAKYSMERQTGRKPGEEDRAHPIRKGLVGDWRNHFTRDCAELFRELAGDTLIRLGYEADHGWVEDFDRGMIRRKA